MLYRQDLRKLDVTAVRELLIYFQDTPPLFQLDLLDVIDENNRMRISHGNRLGGKIETVCGKFDTPEEIPGEAHIHTDPAVFQKRGFHKAALGMQNKDLGAGILGEPAADNELCHAPRGVPAHGGLGTVGVKDAHLKINTLGAAVALQRSHKDNPVGADTETAVAKLYDSLFKSIAKIQRFTRFQKHEIVA